MASTIVRIGAAASRADRHAARRVLWNESRDKRRRNCGRVSVVPGGSVAVRASGTVAGGDRVGGFAGLSTCASVWACPVCSARISGVRHDQLATAVRSWERSGGRVVLLTVTTRHKRSQRLKTLWDAVSYAWGKATSGSGRAYARDCAYYGIAGWARVVEVTVGPNGWHVHVHSLFFIRGDQLDSGEVDLAGLGAVIFSRWSTALVRRGLAAPLEGYGGLDVQLLPKGDSEKIAAYLSKSVYREVDDPVDGLAWEMTGGAAKSAKGPNRTPFQVLRDVVTLGDVDDLDTWHEWERESSGRRQLTWSKGMREQLAIADVTDEEIVEEDLAGEVVAVLEAETWRAWRNVGPLLLEAVETDDTGAGLRALLERGPP